MITNMKFARKFAVIIVLLLVSLLILANPVLAAPQLYEYYNASWFDLLHVQSTGWVAQTFTAISNHKVTTVKLMLKRAAAGGDNPGAVYLILKAVNNSGYPTGATLSSGMTNGNTLTKDYPGEWRSFAMSDCTLEQGKKYALILYNSPGYDSFGWFVDTPNPFAGGNALESTDSGSTWIIRNSFDLNFEVWGVPFVAGSNTQPEIPKPFMDSSSSSPEYSLPGKSDVKVTGVYTQSNQVVAGNPVVIYGNVANRGDLADKYQAILKINGEVEATKTGLVQANFAVPLEFMVYRDKPGTYNVDLNGQKTHFTVIENNSGSELTSNNKLLALALWGILVIAATFALSIVIIRRRKLY